MRFVCSGPRPQRPSPLCSSRASAPEPAPARRCLPRPSTRVGRTSSWNRPETAPLRPGRRPLRRSGRLPELRVGVRPFRMPGLPTTSPFRRGSVGRRRSRRGRALFDGTGPAASRRGLLPQFPRPSRRAHPRYSRFVGVDSGTGSFVIDLGRGVTLGEGTTGFPSRSTCPSPVAASAAGKRECSAPPAGCVADPGDGFGTGCTTYKVMLSGPRGRRPGLMFALRARSSQLSALCSAAVGRGTCGADRLGGPTVLPVVPTGFEPVSPP